MDRIRALPIRPSLAPALAVRTDASRVLDAMCQWRARYGRLSTSYDWSHACCVGVGEALGRLRSGDRPRGGEAAVRFA